MSIAPRQLAWLEPGDPFPDVAAAWPDGSDAPGLLAAGGRLDVPTLLSAYSAAIFPWFSSGQPVLWWSPDPRMVLQVNQFRLHRSLKKRIKTFTANDACEVRIDSDFDAVIRACAHSARRQQNGTWILPDMVVAYEALHRQGHAHSVETWINGELVGGLYCVALGQAVFGESMFSLHTDASKIALAALVGFCRQHAIQWIDCQQNTRHLASLGASEMERTLLQQYVREGMQKASPVWKFDTLYWQHILDS